MTISLRRKISKNGLEIKTLEVDEDVTDVVNGYFG